MSKVARLAAASVFGLTVGTAMAEKAITVASWGGLYAKSQIEAYHKPFTDKNGVEVNSVGYDGGLDEVRDQIESKNVTWDIVDVAPSDAIVGCDEGLFEKLDLHKLPAGADGTPAQDDFIPGTLQDCAVATIIFATIFAYDDTRFAGEKPATWADFFNIERFPGKRGLRRSPRGTLEFALLADGVAPAEVYDVLGTPEGVDRAFRKLDGIKKDIVWWEAGSQAPQLLAEGEVAMTSAYNGRIHGAQQEGKPFKIVWDGQMWDLDLWALLAGAPNRERALEFLAFSTDSERLRRQADWIPYGPARRSAIATMDPDILPNLPTAPGNFANSFQYSSEFWIDQQDGLIEKFDAWLAAE
jgi:putative spermidine/putrescine transport system substrate-binding protein